MVACAGDSGPASRAGTSRPAEGLVEVGGSSFARAWMRPGTDLGGYAIIEIAPPLVAYENAPCRGSSSGLDMQRSERLRPRRMAELRLQLVDAFARELSGIALRGGTGAGEPRTLRVEPAIVGLVVIASGDQPPDDIRYARSTADMTILLDLRDASTGAVVARFAQRSTAETPGIGGPTTLTEVTAGNVVAALRSTFQSWARLLRAEFEAAGHAEALASPAR